MTQQSGETLQYRGRSWSMHGCPLDACDREDVRQRMALFRMRSTALWRGYEGTWAITGGRFWMFDLDATVQTGGSVHRKGLDWLFPGQRTPVLADWFTGALRSGRGRSERTGMYGIDWPYYRDFHIKRGLVTGSTLIDNRVKFRAGPKAGQRV